ncbi:hypothetical protein COO60DRAFT_1642473 [Scenedesmus sp. NREL 46B-D3]|nr:hypothetical protein COO60DRAFT_1642473 [Scenedesmus sp. NREL 46B-D3]
MQFCAAQTSSAIVPLAELAGGLFSGFTDLSSLGGPSFAIDSGLLSWMQSALLDIFDSLTDDGSGISGLLQGWMKPSNAAATGAVAPGSFAAGTVLGGALGVAKGPGPLPHLPPPLPPCRPLRLLADKWGAALTKAQFSPGLQGFLQLLGLADEQEALVKWMCILYPKWTNALLPQPLQDVRDSYCVRALPAAAVSKLVQGPPKPPALGLPGGGFGKPGPLPKPGPMWSLG